MNPLNEPGVFVDRRLIMGRVYLCGDKRKCNINGSQGLESQTHLKWAMDGGTMESPVVTMLDIWETLVPCTRILRIVHAQDVHNHLIDYLGLAINLGVERSGFCDLGVQQGPETRPKGAKESAVLVGDEDLCYPKVNPNSFKEELGSLYRCDTLLTICEDGHFQKPINKHKYIVVSVLGG
jgi:hypothetical protein